MADMNRTAVKAPGEGADFSTLDRPPMTEINNYRHRPTRNLQRLDWPAVALLEVGVAAYRPSKPRIGNTGLDLDPAIMAEPWLRSRPKDSHPTDFDLRGNETRRVGVGRVIAHGAYGLLEPETRLAASS